MLVFQVAAALLLAGDPDGVIATAPETPVLLETGSAPVAPSVQGAAQEAAPHGLTTDQQIDRWLAARDPTSAPFAEGPGPVDDRKVHGEFSAGIGTEGYRDYGAAVSFPIGESGRLDFSWRQVENGYGYRYGQGYYRGWAEPGVPGAPARSVGAGLDWGSSRPEAMQR